MQEDHVRDKRLPKFVFLSLLCVLHHNRLRHHQILTTKLIPWMATV